MERQRILKKAGYTATGVILNLKWNPNFAGVVLKLRYSSKIIKQRESTLNEKLLLDLICCSIASLFEYSFNHQKSIAIGFTAGVYSEVLVT